MTLIGVFLSLQLNGNDPEVIWVIRTASELHQTIENWVMGPVWNL